MPLPVPPKKPLPLTVIVAGERFDPTAELNPLTLGAAAEIAYLSTEDVWLAAPPDVTIRSYVPAGPGF